ncbi:hypothetical protein [Botrimarina hoheduenensis]|uniref:IncA protein n=1 Tax=Botrimarina hoheduenensis TaxID=2528000 RepID=A0A5C5VXW1_9BACT|nr:hypothetical protein [Botrimarina hoheduenensis]TWT42559.1 IncA protein [Botrimarina hoheduenensis]
MKRSPRKQAESAFSLFPFLAVLLCTVGALVVLLVAMAHVSRGKAKDAAAVAAAAVDRAQDDAQAQRAEALRREMERQAQQITGARDAASARLAAEQERLAALDDTIRRLEDEAERLRDEARELLSLDKEHYDDQRVAEQELQRLNELVTTLEEEIEELEAEAGNRQRRYAIVPLRDAVTGTRRPAIYFECRADAVILQPEGIRFERADFIAPTVSSPLGAAVAAVRQYYRDSPGAYAAGESGDPYPLFIIRPDGVPAFKDAEPVLARRDSDYGYQPIAADWPMEYDAPNPELAERVERAIAIARSERADMSLAAPQLFAPRPQSWAWNTEDVEIDEFAIGRGRPIRGGSGGSSNPFAAIAGAYPASGSSGAGQVSGSPALGSAAGNAAPSQGSAGEGSLPSGLGTTSSAASRLGQGGGSNPQQAGGLGGSASDTQTPGEQTFAGQTSQTISPNTSGATGSNAAMSADGSASDQGPSFAAAEGASSASGSPTAGASASSASGADAGSASPFGEPASSSAAQPPTPTLNIAAQPPGKPGSVARNQPTTPGMAVVRSIQMVVRPDAIVILPDRGQSSASLSPSAQGVETPLRGPVSAQAGDVFGALKRHADTWGIAGQGMHWKPRVQLIVAPGAEGRASEITDLLRGAGVGVQAPTRLSQGEAPDATPRR